MNPTGVTQDRELIFVRFEQSFPQFLAGLFREPPGWITVPLAVLVLISGVLALVIAARTARKVYLGDPRRLGRPDGTGWWLWWAAFASWVLLGLWAMVALFWNDTFARQAGAGEAEATSSATNSVYWLLFVAAVFAVGAFYVVWMYVRDAKSIRWYWAAALAGLRLTVYAILCVVFLLPALQTYERTEKKSRVVVLLDVSPSVTVVSDEIGSTPGRKLKTRLATVIDFLTDKEVDFLQRLLDKNPVVVYRFGTRLDEEPQTFTQGEAAWGKDEWEGFARYDFKPFLLRGLSDAGKEAVRNSAAWAGDKPGTPEWAAVWFGRPEEEGIPGGMSDEDKAALKENRTKLEKRIDVARSIALGTNAPDSVTAAVNREASNMVQGIVVFSDGRSNIGSDSAYAELKERATREKIPIFTVAVGEDRQTVAIAITDVQAPDNAPPDEPFKIVVEADGVNLANQTVNVELDLFLPGRDPKADAPDYTFKDSRKKKDRAANPGGVVPYTLTFQPGDPPHGQVEFIVDPEELPEALTQDSEDAAIKKRVLKEGGWFARARIAKDKREAFPDPEHVRDRPGIQVVKKPLRVLLVASGPSREYQALKTLLVREAQNNRAEVCILMQNEAGLHGGLVQDIPPERLLTRFPYILDVTGKKIDPKDRFYNLNEYDLIVAFDPDWSELSQEQAQLLQRWVQEQGGGLIYVAGPLNTFQLARVEQDSRLSPILNIIPVVPEDIIVLRARPIPRTPRRLHLHPMPGSELLKLEETGDDPIGGWERFFTDREKYAENKDLKVELFPRRGFFSYYPVKDVKPGAKVLADFADLDERGDKALRPWIVTNNPNAGWRTCFLASGELYRLFAFDPPNGKEFFQRFWVKAMKYIAAKRNAKAARGRVLVSKEYVGGSPIRIQARVLDPSSKPYPEGAIDPKFKIVQVTPNGDRREFGPFEMAHKRGPAGFDGYYQGQVLADPKQFPPGDFVYRVVVDVPDSAGETIEGEFAIRRSDPEMDNTRPDIAALLAMATELDANLAARITNLEAKDALAARLPKENGVPKLAFRLGDRDLLRYIPECMKTEERNISNRGNADHLWDRGFAVPTSWTSGLFNFPQTISYVLLIVVLLLSVEWATRKILRLA